MNHSYKKLVKTRFKIMVVIAVLSIIAMTVGLALRLLVFQEAELSVSQISKVVFVFAAVEAVSIFRLIQYSKILKDDAKLEEMEIAEYDERGRYVRQNASRMCIWIFIVFIAVAIIISSFFNKTVFFTLTATLLFILVLYTSLKIIYGKMN